MNIVVRAAEPFSEKTDRCTKIANLPAVPAEARQLRGSGTHSYALVALRLMWGREPAAQKAAPVVVVDAARAAHIPAEPVINPTPVFP
jgi:hypothetical protein